VPGRVGPSFVGRPRLRVHAVAGRAKIAIKKLQKININLSEGTMSIETEIERDKERLGKEVAEILAECGRAGERAHQAAKREQEDTAPRIAGFKVVKCSNVLFDQLTKQGKQNA